MSDRSGNRLRLTLAAVLALALAGALISLRQHQARPERRSASAASHLSDPIPITIYTNPGATTPQIPLWAALKQPAVRERFDPHISVWKTAAHLQSILLAGEGDIWVGHVDGFARARARGAPVVLLAVTGWRKFALVSRDPQVSSFQDVAGTSLPYAPMGCPSVDILLAVLGEEMAEVEFVPYEPKQLALKTMQGRVQSALLPEPLVTVLLDKMPDLRVVANVEDIYSRLNGGKPRMPIAGIAVREDLLRSRPQAIAELREAVVMAARTLADDPEAAAAVLPEAFADVMPERIVRASLARDLILAERASDVADEVRRYLRIVTPELFDGADGLPDAFFGIGAAEVPSH